MCGESARPSYRVTNLGLRPSILGDPSLGCGVVRLPWSRKSGDRRAPEKRMAVALRATPNAYVHQLLVEHLAGMLKNPHVKADLENRASFDAAATAATPLRSKRRGNVEPATPDAAPKGRRTRKSRGGGSPAP